MSTVVRRHINLQIRNVCRKVGMQVAKEINLQQVISKLAKIGVSATLTKSRLEMLKVLAPPKQHPPIQSH